MSERVRAVGAMSGTSLDGVDAAVLETDGVSIAAFGESAYRAYAPQEREIIRLALGLWGGPEVDAAAAIVERAHLDLLSDFGEAELVGFHGQTLAHDPRRRTLQAGDGARLAEALSQPVAWDFRSADVAEGGEGAPLAPFFHHACARWAGLSGRQAFLNLGGVGNLTLLDADAPDPAAPGVCLAFDTGPANAPIDDLMRRLGRGAFDRDGRLAAEGRADEARVAQVLSDKWFDLPPPKSLDRNAFAARLSAIGDLPAPDAAATLVAVAAEAVARGLRLSEARPDMLHVAGGGRRNGALMRALEERTGARAQAVEGLGLDGDMLEAQAFAFLAVRVLKGLPLSAPATTGVAAPCRGGRIALPSAAAGQGVGTHAAFSRSPSEVKRNRRS